MSIKGGISKNKSALVINNLEEVPSIEVTSTIKPQKMSDKY